MATSEQIASKVLCLEPAEFYRLDPDLKDLITTNLGQFEFQGLAVNGPDQVNISEKKTLPVFLLISSTILRQWEFDLEWNCTVLAVELESGNVIAGEALMPPPSKRPFEEKPVRGPQPSLGIGKSRVRGVYAINLMQVPGFPETPGTYAVTLFSFDWFSNTTVLNTISDALPTNGDALATLRPTPPIVRGESDAFPLYNHHPRSPALIDRGIAITRSVEISPSDSNAIPVFGTIRFQVKRQQIIPRTEEVHESKTTLQAAVVMVNLLAIGKDSKKPHVITLAVPVHSDKRLRSGDEVEAFFGVDLADLPESSLPVGEYCLYGVFDRYVDGPMRFKIE